MKDAIMGILIGIALGMLLIFFMVFGLRIQENGSYNTNGDVNTTTENFIETQESTESMTEPESATEPESMTEPESVTEPEGTTESETGTVTVVPSESESESEPESSENSLPYYIKVNRKQNCITIYTKDAQGEYTVPVKAMICSVGTGSRTPRGIFKISNQYRWHALYMDSYGQYCSRIAEHILFHSVPYSKKSPSALRDGVYNALGQKASLGCIRLTVIDAKWIYDNCAPGTVVEIYDSSDPGPLGKPTALIIDEDSPYKGWDPTDPDSSNPWKSVPITISGVKNLTVECGTEVDLLSHVSALDIDGNTSLPVAVQGNVDVNTPGSYRITYFAVGAIGTTASVQATVTVVAVEKPSEVPTESEKTTESEVPTESEASTESESSMESETMMEAGSEKATEQESVDSEASIESVSQPED